jgi:replicative DNA helicase Mcm
LPLFIFFNVDLGCIYKLPIGEAIFADSGLRGVLEMEAAEQIRKFEEFFDIHYKLEILQNIQADKNLIVVDFLELANFDPELSEELLEHPEEVIKAAELAIKSLDIPEDKRIRVRFTNVSATQKIRIRDIRTSNLGKLIIADGMVRQKSDVRPQVTSTEFECPSCGNVITVLQLDTKFKEPTRCSCGRKGKFKLLNKELVDAQRITLEESPDDLDGAEQPKRVNVFLKEDQVSPMTDRRTNPGSKIRITGIIKEIPRTLKSGGISTTYDIVIESNYIEPRDEDYTKLLIKPEEEAEIRALSRDSKVFDKLIRSIAPSIYGHDRVKEALILQLFGGVQKTRKDGSITRGDIHILLIGDPGAGKSQLLKRVKLVAPKASYVSGKGASGVGLTAAVIKDEFLKGYALEAGALVLANKGLCCIDELDKMTEEDTSAMHEALEQQTVTIAKANIQATLLAQTTVLAAANPKLGRFDPYEPPAAQIDLPPALISRFDLIFPIKDIPDLKNDEKMALFILKSHQSSEMEETEVNTALFKKYIAYAKQTMKPVLSEEAIQDIMKYFVDLRNKSGNNDRGIKAIPITPRQLEALERLAEAAAKVRLSSVVTKEDAKRAIDLLHYCFTQVGMDKETGQIDIDRITTGITSSERGKIVQIREIINNLELMVGKTKPIPIDDILREAADHGISGSDVEEGIEKLRRSGDIFEPRRGYIQKL